MLTEEANEGTGSWLVDTEAAVDGAVASLPCVEEGPLFSFWPTADGVGGDASIMAKSL